MSEKIDTKNHPTVKALIEQATRLDLTDAVIAKRYIGISKTTWSQLQSGTYPAQDPAPMLEKCAAALQLLIDEAERAEFGAQGAIVALPHVNAALAAVKGCHGSPQNRLVVYLAPSGGGKTTLVRRLQETYRSAAVFGEATETWRGSYLNAAADIAAWLGIEGDFVNPRKAEAAVLGRLAATPIILCVDEGHYCGPEALNFIKAILNRTLCRVVFLSIPELWSRMEKKAYEEAKQLRRRTHAKIVIESVSPGDCRTFIRAKLTGYDAKAADEKAIVGVMCAAANDFGLYDTLQRICDEVAKECDGGPATLDLVTAAIKRVEALR